jgi:hypothetical protein
MIDSMEYFHRGFAVIIADRFQQQHEIALAV